MAVNSIVARDLNKILTERLGVNPNIDALLTSKFDNFYSDMEDRATKLNDLDTLLLDQETSLRKALKESFFDDDAVIDGIMKFSFTGDEKELRENLALSLTGIDGNLTRNTQVMDMIYKYNQTYTNYFNAFVDDVHYTTSVGETIRQDKMLYTIGIETGKGKLKEYILNSDQATKFMSQRESFGLYRDKNGNISLSLHHGYNNETGENISKYGLNATKLASNLEKALGNDIGGRTSLRQHALGYNQETGKVDYSIRQEIWTALRNSNLFSERSLEIFKNTDNMDDLVRVMPSREYEILNNGIWNQVYNQNLSAAERTTLIGQIINNYEVNGYDIGENIAGVARGDNLLTGLKGQYSTQQKFFGSAGNEYGFSIMSFTAMSNALNYYSQQRNINRESEQAAENILESEAGQRAINREGLLLMYQQGAQMLADMGFIEQDEVDSFANQAMSESEGGGDYDDSDLEE